MPPVSQNLISFSSDALSDQRLLVARLEGVDRISRLYRYELELVSGLAALDIRSIVGATCTIGIKQGVTLHGADGRGKRTALVNGVVTEFELGEKRHDQVTYRAVVQPRMWNLTRTFVSQVYLDAEIRDLVVANLTSAGLVEGTDFDLSRLTGDYPRRDYVVQYEETDFDFLCRWLEHEGIFFYFEQGETGDRLVFGDDQSAYPDIVGASDLAWRPPQSHRVEAEVREGADATEDWFSEEVIQSARWRQQPVPTEVRLKDYNWRNPDDPLEVRATVDPDRGVGLWWEYNDHFKTNAEGKQLAAVRSGELRVPESLLVGESDCRSMQAGAVFQLREHFRGELNARWLLLEVRHHATQTIALATGSSVSATYSNEFVAMPADRTYRPERITDWPSIKGVIHAVVDSTLEGKPDINQDGAYRVRLPFDIAGSEKGTGAASRYIRFAQPYAGRGYGTHFPLRAGAEVVLTHIDGDPDRPIIAGAVPNRTNPSPVTRGNQEKNIIRSSSGNLIEMDDTPGLEGLTMYNGAMSVITSFRNTTAGGGGGAGGLTPGPTTGHSRAAELPPLDGSANAAGGGFTGASFSSRAGLFSGPLSQLSADGLAMVPGIALSPGSAEMTEGEIDTSGASEAHGAEDLFVAANTPPDSATWHDFMSRVVSEDTYGGGNFKYDNRPADGEDQDLRAPNALALRALARAQDIASDPDKSKEEVASELEDEALTAWEDAREEWRKLDDDSDPEEGTHGKFLPERPESSLSDLKAVRTQTVGNSVPDITGEDLLWAAGWRVVDHSGNTYTGWYRIGGTAIQDIDCYVLVYYEPGDYSDVDDAEDALNESNNRIAEKRQMIRLDYIGWLSRRLQNLTNEAWVHGSQGEPTEDMAEGYLDRSQYAARHDNEQKLANWNQWAQILYQKLQEALALCDVADEVRNGTGTPADIVEGMWDAVDDGAVEFTCSNDAHSQARIEANRFTGVLNDYTFVNGFNVEVTYGHHGRYRDGSKTEVNVGDVRYDYNNYSRRTNQIIVHGDDVAEMIIGGRQVRHTTVLGGVDEGTTTIFAPGYGKENATDEEMRAIGSAGPATIYGNIDAQNTVVHGTINGRNLTVYADPDGDGVAVNGMTQHIYGDIEGQNKYVYGYSNGETFVRDENRSKTVVGSSHSESFCPGTSFSASDVGVSLSQSFVGVSASSTMIGTSHSLTLGGVHTSLNLNVLNLSVHAAAIIDIAASLVGSLSLSGKLDIALGYEFKFSGMGSTELNPIARNKVHAAENRLVALETKVKTNETNITSLKNDIGSSRRWKQNIVDLQNALDLVARLRGVRYEWKADGTPDVGFIAEEVGEVLPEVVEYEDNGIDAKSVCYAKLTAVLVEAVKEQQQQIEAQQAQLDDMRRELDALAQTLAVSSSTTNE